MKKDHLVFDVSNFGKFNLVPSTYVDVWEHTRELTAHDKRDRMDATQVAGSDPRAVNIFLSSDARTQASNKSLFCLA